MEINVPSIQISHQISKYQPFIFYSSHGHKISIQIGTYLIFLSEPGSSTIKDHVFLKMWIQNHQQEKQKPMLLLSLYFYSFCCTVEKVVLFMMMLELVWSIGLYLLLTRET